MIDIEEAKKKFLTPSEFKIAICSVDEIKEMVLTIEQQKNELENMNLELFEARKTIRELKNKNRYHKYMQLEQENLAMAEEIQKYKEILGGKSCGCSVQCHKAAE